MSPQDKCRRCGAPLIWCVTVTGKKIAVDMVRNACGNLVLESEPCRIEPVVRYVRYGEGTHVGHACPKGDKDKNTGQGSLPGMDRG